MTIPKLQQPTSLDLAATTCGKRARHVRTRALLALCAATIPLWAHAYTTVPRWFPLPYATNATMTTSSGVYKGIIRSLNSIGERCHVQMMNAPEGDTAARNKLEHAKRMLKSARDMVDIAFINSNLTYDQDRRDTLVLTETDIVTECDNLTNN